MSDRVVGGYYGGGKFAILVEIKGEASRSAVEDVLACIRRCASRAGLTAKIVWPKRGKKKKK